MESEKIVFNDDVLVDVLARLPPESVVRFKSVSPHWMDLLSSPDFFRRYAAANRDGVGRLLAFFQEADPVRETRTPETCNTLPICKNLIRENKIPNHVGRFVSSSNGLILCSRTRGHQISYHVGNPLTGKFVKLPLPLGGRCSLVVNGRESIVAAPTLISTVLVCEEDNNKNEAVTYSVIQAGMMNMFRGGEPEDTKSLYIESYSSKTGKWSPMIRLVASENFYLSVQPAVVVNGVIHWYTDSKSILVYNPKGKDKGGDPHLQFINVPKAKIRRCWPVTRTSDGVLWLGLMQRHDFKFYMLPEHYMSKDDAVDAKEWVLIHEISIFTLSRMMKKGLVACKEATLECLIPQSRSEIVAVLRQEEKLFLYNVKRKSLVKLDYSGCYNKEYSLYPYLQSSSLSSYRL